MAHPKHVVTSTVIFDSIPGLYLILKPDFTIAEVSDSYLTVTRHTKDLMVGHNLLDFFFRDTNKIDIKDKQKIKASLQYVLETGKEHTVTVKKYCSYSNTAKFEEAYWRLQHVPYFNHRKELTHIIHKIQHINKQAAFINTIEKIITPIPQRNEQNSAVFFLDKKGCIASWNNDAACIKGYSAAEIIGKPIDIFYTKEDNLKKIPQNILQKTLENGHYETEGWRLRKDGTLFYAKIMLTVQLDDHGRHTGFSKVVQNLTTKRRAEEHTHFLASIASHIQDPVIACDNSYTITKWNTAAENLLGWKSEETVGKTTLEVLTPTYKLESRDQMLNTLLEKGFWQGEVIYHAKSGKPVDVSVTISALTNLEGDITGSFAIIRDITERKKAELVMNELNNALEIKVAERTGEILKREKRFRSLIENSSDAIILIDASLNYIYRSPSASRISDYTIDELQNTKCTVNIHPDDVETVNLKFKELLAHPGSSINLLFRNKHKNGHYTWIEGVATNLLHEEYLKAIVINSRDVTYRVEAAEKLAASEKQFRNRLDGMMEGIQIHDFSWRYIYVNDTYQQYTSFTKEELIGFTLFEKFPQIPGTDLYKKLQHCMNKRESAQMEIEFLHKDGMIGYYQLSIKPVPEGIFVLSIDITHRKRAEQEIIQSEENLKAIFDNTSEGFLLTDKEGIIKAYNTTAKTSILQNSIGKIKTGQSIFDYTEPDRKEYIEKVFDKVIKGETIEYNRLYYYPKRNPTWINYIFNPVIKDNIVQGVCITGRDITAVKLTQQQREFDSNNLNALINNTADRIWSVDLDFNLITSNKSFDKKLIRLTGNALVKGSNVLTAITDKMQMNRYKTYYQRSFGGETFTIVEHIKTINDLWSEISFQPIYEGDKIIGVACFARDISKRIKIEQELKNSFIEKKALAKRMSAILNTLPANIALLDSNGIILDVNDSWRNFADANEFIGNNYCVGDNYIAVSKNSIDINKDGINVANGITDVLSGRLPEFVFEYECHSPEKERWFRMIVTPLQKVDYSGAVVMHIDISALRILEKERLDIKTGEHQKITQAIIWGQEKERNHIGRELHDNINQILAATKLFLSAAGNRDNEIKDLVKYPLELLEMSIDEIRMLCQKLVTPLKNINLKELINGLITKLELNTGIQVTFLYSIEEATFSDDLKLNLYRIIQELSHNILKYAKAKKVTLTIFVIDNTLHVIVTDDGIGFDVNKTRKGIGISNIINRIETFNGTVEIISREGEGCKTIIIVPQ